MLDNKISIVQLSKQIMAFSQTMINGSNLKSCSKLFCVVLLFKTCVIAATVYVLLSFHFDRDLGGFFNRPVARRLQNWTQVYLRSKLAALTDANSTPKATGGSRNVPTRSLNKKSQVLQEKTSGAFKKTVKQKRNTIKHNGKRKVIIFVGIFSAPQRIFRRNALRRSWLKQCKKKKIPCLFFTDSQDMRGTPLPSYIYVPLLQEKLLHGDMILAESPGGINFALRYLWMLNWANKHYEFKYFLRVDDDYFVCMDRLLRELPHRPRKKLYWGHVHCSPPGGIRVDEGFVIVSNDLAQRFLREQNRTLMCHPYGDQAMSMWINNIPGVIYFGDPRVHHSVAGRDHTLRYHKDVCGDFLAIHGSYPVEIETFWLKYLTSGKRKNYAIPAITYPCGKMNKTYNYMSFAGMYNAKPRPCREHPTWNIGEFYGGRSGQ